MLGTAGENKFVYNLIANQPIEDDLVDKLFTEVDHSEDILWKYAYPESKATKVHQPFKLDDNIFYINTMESAASTMEASIIGAKNVIHLVKRSLD